MKIEIDLMTSLALRCGRLKGSLQIIRVFVESDLDKAKILAAIDSALKEDETEADK